MYYLFLSSPLPFYSLSVFLMLFQTSTGCLSIVWIMPNVLTRFTLLLKLLDKNFPLTLEAAQKLVSTFDYLLFSVWINSHSRFFCSSNRKQSAKSCNFLPRRSIQLKKTKNMLMLKIRIYSYYLRHHKLSTM